jgi:small conductance mechanosensitive channel
VTFIFTCRLWRNLNIGLFIMLGVLGLEEALNSLLVGIGMLGLALGFAFKNIGLEILFE